MVKVAGPAMSLDASGSLGGAIVFSSWKGRKYARTLVVPKNPKTTLQVGIRSMMKGLTQPWKAFTTQKATWALAAAADSISPFNVYVRNNMREYRSDLYPSQIFTAPRISTPDVIASITATPGTRHIVLEITGAPISASWLIAIHRGLTTGFVPSWANVVAVIPYLGFVQTWTDAPLVADTYYYRVTSIAMDGASDNTTSECNGVVP